MKDKITLLIEKALKENYSPADISLMIVLFLEFDIELSLAGNGLLDDDTELMNMLEVDEDKLEKWLTIYRSFLE